MGVLLISEVKLKNFTNINKNVDMDVLKAEVQIAQDIDLQTILGTKFYNHLLSQVSATGNTFNADETELVNKLPKATVGIVGTCMVTVIVLISNGNKLVKL